MNKRLITGICCFFLFTAVMAQRTEVLLEKGWKFFRGDISGAAHPGYDDEQWQAVTVPHDWAIYGPFDRDNDLQKVAVTQNFEKQASVKTGRTGGLPYVGVGWYRTTFTVPARKQATLVFDGAMSEARVYINGQEACFCLSAITLSIAMSHLIYIRTENPIRLPCGWRTNRSLRAGIPVRGCTGMSAC